VGTMANHILYCLFAGAMAKKTIFYMVFLQALWLTIFSMVARSINTQMLPKLFPNVSLTVPKAS
jgi:hypothetical protein